MLSLNKILADFDVKKPLILTPYGGTGELDYEQSIYASNKIAILTTSRPVVEWIKNRRDPNGQVMTAARFRGRANEGWECVVVLGVQMIGNMRSQQSRAIRQLRAKGARVVCISSTAGDPTKIYSVAQALGVAGSVFGSYNNFVNTYCEQLGPGFGQAWVAGIKQGKVGELANATRSFCDTSLLPNDMEEEL